MLKLWEAHTIAADTAFKQDDHLRSLLHYKQAHSLSEKMIEQESINVDERLLISMVSCHNLAQFWRRQGEQRLELKYLQLASENALSLVPKCPNTQCHSFISSIGCCKNALIEFMKRHPNPDIARMVVNLEHATNCELIAKFRLH